MLRTCERNDETSQHVLGCCSVNMLNSAHISGCKPSCSLSPQIVRTNQYACPIRTFASSVHTRQVKPSLSTYREPSHMPLGTRLSILGICELTRRRRVSACVF